MSQILVTGEAKIRDIQGPVVANSGVITALDGAASQYVRGDGTLADFPTSTGGGSSVSYYLNSSVSQGTIGGVAYRELSKNPIIGAGTDITISANGYVANYITDVNDPDVVLVPGGNFNCEFYFSVNNNTGNPTTYAELYKYDGTTFTLLGTSAGVPESINQGTTIAPYYFAIPVATAALSVTDRLAIRIYVNVDGRTVTLHTENGHLCQVVTTLSKGMVSLNNLTDQSQYLTTGTSGTNFNIVSSGDTHTFNLPVASATNTGKLSNTDWSTFNNKLSTATAAATYVPYTGATSNVNLGVYDISVSGIKVESNVSGGTAVNIKQNSTTLIAGAGYISIGAKDLDTLLFQYGGATNSDYKVIRLKTTNIPNTTSRAYEFPNADGTIALTSNIPSVSGTSTYIPVFTGTNSLGNSQIWNNGGIIGMGTNYSNPAFYVVASSGDTLTQGKLAINTTSFSGTSVLQVNGAATLTGNLTGTTAAFSSFVNAFSFTAIGGTSNAGQISLKHTGAISVGDGYVTIAADSSNTLGIYFFNSFSAKFSISALTNNRTYTLPDGTGTLALTSNLSDYLPLTGGTLTGGLSGTTATFSGLGTFYQLTMTGATAGRIFYAQTGGVVSQSGNLNWNETNGMLGVGTPNPSAVITAFSTNAATQFKAAGTAPAFTFSQSLTTSTYACVFGLATSANHFITGTAAGDMAIANQSATAGAIVFGTGTAERMRMSSSGNFGIGTSSPTERLEILGPDGSGAAVRWRMAGGRKSGYLYSDSAGVAIYDTNLNDAGIYLAQNTQIDFRVNGSQRMLINSSGNVGIGTSSPGAQKLYVNTAGSSTATFSCTRNAGVDDFNIITLFGSANNNTSTYHILCATGGADKLYVYGNGNVVNTNGSYGTLSDITLKENIVDATPKLADILNLKVRNFNLIGDDTKQIGFIAQEFEEVFPSMIDLDGKSGKKAIKTSVLTPMLVKGLQELKAEKDAEIAELRNQIEELKALINK